MGYIVKRRGETVRTFECFHDALQYGRIVGNDHVTDGDGMILAVHGNPGDAEERNPHETSALRRAQAKNDKRTGHVLRAPDRHFAHEVHDETGCDHSWQRYPHDWTSFRCCTCGALGYRTVRPTQYADVRPVLPRRCGSRGCRDVARHNGAHGTRTFLCELHRDAEVAA
jgi:hypothetical protein